MARRGAKRGGNFTPYYGISKKTGRKNLLGYANEMSGEFMSRRQYDKTYGILKEQGFVSYVQKVAVRARLGLSNLIGGKKKTSALEKLSKPSIEHTRKGVDIARSGEMTAAQAKKYAKALDASGIHFVTLFAGGRFKHDKELEVDTQYFGERVRTKDIPHLISRWQKLYKGRLVKPRFTIRWAII